MESKDNAGLSKKAPGMAPERCRTCQKRKVKCGQEMPVCFNCERLGLQCERKAKYKLKDVTQKTRKSIASTTSERGSIWDPKYVRSPLGKIPDENLSAMENAALSEKPGTFFIDSTPENVLGMYNDDDESEVMSSVGTLIAVPPPPASVKMERFEDYGNASSVATASRKSVARSLLKRTLTKSVTGSQYSSTTISTGASLAKRFMAQEIHSRVHSSPLTMFNKALVRSRDLQYYNHYRSVVVYNMQVNSRIPTDVKPFCHDANETEDPFETAASSFNPLYHAMMALAALSLAHRERLDRVDALEHYQQAVTGLRQYQGPESVNLIYTHYFLLLYEVAACEEGQANLEFNQMAQLTHLLGWFFTTASTDPAHVFSDQKCAKCTQVTMTCIPSNMLYCDMYNLLLHRQKEVIVPDEMVVGFFNAVEIGQTDESAFKERSELSHMMSLPPIPSSDTILPHAVAKLSVRGGWSYRVLRNLIQDVLKLPEGEIMDIEPRLRELDEKIRDMHEWCMKNNPPLPRDMWDEWYTQIPLQIQTGFDSSQYTLRALQIYAYTSVHPSHFQSLSPLQIAYIQRLAQEILDLTRPRFGAIRPIAASNLMAIFMCGLVVENPADREEVLNVLRKMGGTASGRNFERAGEALILFWREMEMRKSFKSEDGREGEKLDWLSFLRGRGMLDFSLFGI